MPGREQQGNSSSTRTASATVKPPKVPAGHVPSGHRLALRADALELVSVKLDLESQTFKVLNAPLSEVSPYFNKALDGRFLEADINTLTLPNTTSTTFMMFLEWLYGRKIPVPGAEEKAVRLGKIFELYIFGDMFDVPQLREDAFDTAAREFEAGTLPPLGACGRAFSRLLEGSPLIRWIIDEYCARWRPGGDLKLVMGEMLDGCPHSFTITLLMNMARQRNKYKTSSYLANPCAYHEHKTDEEKENCKKKRTKKKDA